MAPSKVVGTGAGGGGGGENDAYYADTKSARHSSKRHSTASHRRTRPSHGPNFPVTPNPLSIPTPDHTKKRLIICCDGTWKSSDRGPLDYPSNITRLSRALNCVAYAPKTGNEIQQIVYYQSGVGTAAASKVGSALAGGLGVGLDDNVRDAYGFLTNNYQGEFEGQPADEIFLFGFSRGAYTVRALSGLISAIGVLTKKGMDDFATIYSYYKKGPRTFASYVSDIQSRLPRGQLPFDSQRNVTIKVIGCFETVGSLGLPRGSIVDSLNLNKDFDFYNTELSAGVENAFHALGLDEKRSAFVPTLWYLPDTGTQTATDKKKHRHPRPRVRLPPTNIVPGTDPNATAPYVNLIQCWFPGVHSDVGGGYAEGEIGDMTLAWMIDCCRPFLDFDNSYLTPMCSKSQTATEEFMHKSSKKKSRRSSSVDEFYKGSGSLHLSDAWGLGMVHDSRRGIFRFQGTTARTPAQYNIGVTNEVMHSSVRYRYERLPSWVRQCDPLRGFDYFQLEDGRWEWVKRVQDEEVVLPEWRIKSRGRSTEAQLAGRRVLMELDEDVR